MPEPSLLTRDQAASYLDISTDTLDRLRQAGKLKAAQLSSRIVRYRRVDLEEYIETQCQNTPSSRSPRLPTGTSSGARLGVPDALRRARQMQRKLKVSSLHSS